MPLIEARKPKLHAARTRVKVEADAATGDLPKQIEVLRAGTWPEMSNKGMLFITPTDLQQYVDNFNAGVGMTAGLKQLPIDFMHEEWDQAAGWITGLSVQGDVLVATVTWSQAGAEALTGGMFKLFSPSFYPSCLGEWCDYEDWSVTATNVLVGGALTNIPFFKSLQPIMASRDSQEGQRGNILFVEANSERSNMAATLDEVRVKDASALTDEDKALLEQNKSELSADEKTKFNIVDEVITTATENEEVVADTPEVKEALAVQASIKSGAKVLVNASEHEALKASVAELQASAAVSKEKEVRAELLGHVNAGRIKSDTVDKWTKRVIADATVMEDIAALPVNKLLEGELGSAGTGASIKASTELKEKAEKLMADNKELSTAQAYKQVTDNDKDLADRLAAERKGQE